MAMRFLAVASLLAATALAAAAQPAPSAAPAPGQDPNASARKICRVSPANGSRLGGTRTCRTRQEWIDHQREARLVTERIQASTSACLAASNNPQSPGPICSN